MRNGLKGWVIKRLRTVASEVRSERNSCWQGLDGWEFNESRIRTKRLVSATLFIHLTKKTCYSFSWRKKQELLTDGLICDVRISIAAKIYLGLPYIKAVALSLPHRPFIFVFLGKCKLQGVKVSHVGCQPKPMHEPAACRVKNSELTKNLPEDDASIALTNSFRVLLTGQWSKDSQDAQHSRI